MNSFNEIISDGLYVIGNKDDYRNFEGGMDYLIGTILIGKEMHILYDRIYFRRNYKIPIAITTDLRDGRNRNLRPRHFIYIGKICEQ